MRGDDLLVTRIKRKPCVWLVERYLDDGRKVRLHLIKGAKGTPKKKLWRLHGSDGARLFSTRRAALRFASRVTLPKKADEDEATPPL